MVPSSRIGVISTWRTSSQPATQYAILDGREIRTHLQPDEELPRHDTPNNRGSTDLRVVVRPLF